ncbi:PIG-L deacetylase family protein [Desertihabitans aurantiacus]|uniref:PIG-L deacetylase family protein n=1 Tax=Desertihabitans aurantiacus TaxID=2282477 RepID=UPI000DF81483|nr:PIG-L deacetylase family protein [Desertihabitans aurantiacus]
MDLDEVERALVVVAHCDDAEWMCGGTVARLTERGARVDYVVVTDGASGGVDLGVSDADLAATRAAEQRAAARVLGVSEVVLLGRHNDELRVDVALKRDIVREIRRSQPQLVLTMTPFRDLDAPLEWSHGDHIAVGEATLQAVYPEAIMPRIHPELAGEGLQPHTVSEVWFPVGRGADRYVDVTSEAQRKMDAVWCHHSQNGEARGDRDWLFGERVEPPMLRAGERVGARYAEAFRRVAVPG